MKNHVSSAVVGVGVLSLPPLAGLVHQHVAQGLSTTIKQSVAGLLHQHYGIVVGLPRRANLTCQHGLLSLLSLPSGVPPPPLSRAPSLEPMLTTTYETLEQLFGQDLATILFDKMFTHDYAKDLHTFIVGRLPGDIHLTWRVRQWLVRPVWRPHNLLFLKKKGLCVLVGGNPPNHGGVGLLGLVQPRAGLVHKHFNAAAQFIADH